MDKNQFEKTQRQPVVLNKSSEDLFASDSDTGEEDYFIQSYSSGDDEVINGNTIINNQTTVLINCTNLNLNSQAQVEEEQEANMSESFIIDEDSFEGGGGFLNDQNDHIVEAIDEGQIQTQVQAISILNSISVSAAAEADTVLLDSQERVHFDSTVMHELTLNYDDHFDNIEDSSNEESVVEYQPPQVVLNPRWTRYSFVNIPVLFPYKAYQSQKEMMETLIRGMTSGMHCLMESPTGTGKTAALLCALRAFQESCKLNMNLLKSARLKRLEYFEKNDIKCECEFEQPDRKILISQGKDSRGNIKYKLMSIPLDESNDQDQKSKGEEECKEPPAKAARLDVNDSKNPLDQTSTLNDTLQDQTINLSTRQAGLAIIRGIDDLCGYCIQKYLNVDTSRPPRIYYATRTHSQIAQVVKQFKSSPYGENVKMTILGSRQNYCLNEEVLKSKNRNDICNKMKGNYFKNKAEEKKDSPQDSSKSTSNAPAPVPTQNQTNSNALLPTQVTRASQQSESSEKKKKKLPTCEYFESYMDYRGKKSKGYLGGLDETSWDIEEMKETCNCSTVCPYFTSKWLNEEAEIIFLPYNYLIYPFIREMSGIELTGSIMVFDEAHNIEGFCMDAASMSINLRKLDLEIRLEIDTARDFLPSLERQGWNTADLEKTLGIISRFLKDLSTYVSKKDKQFFPQFYEQSSSRNSKYQSNKDAKVVKIQTILDEWKEYNITQEEIHLVLRGIAEAYNEDGNTLLLAEFNSKYASYTRNDTTALPPFSLRETLKKVKKYFNTLNYLYEKKMANMDDFCGVLEHEEFNEENENSDSAEPSLISQLVLQKRGRKSLQQNRPPTINFHIYCLNPGLAFAVVKNAAHSVVVASGTLSPMFTFEQELGTYFGQKLCASHVVPKENIWTGHLVETCSQAIKWDMLGQNNESNYDSLGEMIIQACNKIPKGILVFVSSYYFLDKLRQRWSSYPKLIRGVEQYPILSQLSLVKKVFFEDKNKEVNQQLVDNYKGILDQENSDAGAIYFGVFRGKVSEGVDFKDDHARAIISIGIPYLSKLDPKIKEKINFIDKKKIPGYTSEMWYQAQAFRALNQGLGRCIRDKNDWGALLLFDERFGRSYYTKNISNWIKTTGRYRQYLNYESLLESLENFVKAKAPLPTT